MNKVEGLWERLTDWKRSPVYGYFMELEAKRQQKQEERKERLIRTLKNGIVIRRRRAARVLERRGDPSTVPALVGALKDRDAVVRGFAAWALGKIIRKCKTIIKKCKTVEELEEVEKRIDKDLAALSKEKDKDVRITAQIEIASLTREIAKRKDELAPKRDLFLDDKPKPPKKGRGVYQVSRRVRNG